MLGLCREYDPEMWFPEMPVGFAGKSKMIALRDATNRAIEICGTCPIQAQCLDEGMKDENLAYGIWGGVMAGERLMRTGKNREDYHKTTEEAKAIDLFHKLAFL
jgi:hypothetical protein